jgi:hypothetical protein
VVVPLPIELIVEIAMKTMTRTILSAIVVAGLAAATPAFATTMANFTIDVPGGTVYTFSLPDSLTGASNNGSDDFSVSGVAITITGNGTQAGSTIFSNLVGFGDGGIGIYGLTPNTLDLDYLGPVLFTGTLADPTFKTGTFTLISDADPDDSADDATLTIYTPEPGTLVLFGMGLLFLAGLMRRKLRLPQAGRVVLK